MDGVPVPGRERDVSRTVLLDTHVLLWYDAAPENLSDAVRETLRGRDARVLVSAMTALEIAIKHRLGKLPQADALLAGYEATLARYGFEELPLASAPALRVARIDHAHPDPFDRVLAAQALELDIPLVTRDPVFHGFAELETLW